MDDARYNINARCVCVCVCDPCALHHVHRKPKAQLNTTWLRIHGASSKWKWLHSQRAKEYTANGVHKSFASFVKYSLNGTECDCHPYSRMEGRRNRNIHLSYARHENDSVTRVSANRKSSEKYKWHDKPTERRKFKRKSEKGFGWTGECESRHTMKWPQKKTLSWRLPAYAYFCFWLRV